jgi:hypothetical protein
MVEKKVWWKSKAVWAGIVAVAVAAYNTASEQFGLPVIPEFVYMILGAFGVYGRMVAKDVIGGK